MLKYDLFKELDAETVFRLREGSSNIGKSYLALARKSKSVYDRQYLATVAGTYFRRAAADSLLLDELENASKLFRSAARCYSLTSTPYSSVMKALAGVRSSDKSSLKPEERGRSPEEVFALIELIGRRPREVDSHMQWRHKLDEFRGSRIGIFALQLDSYLEVVDALLSVARGFQTAVSTLQQAVLPFLEL